MDTIEKKTTGHIMAGSEAVENDPKPPEATVILAQANQELMAGTLDALRYLRETINDTNAPHTVRERCADSLLDRAGIVRQKDKEKDSNQGKSIENMDLRDLETFIKQTQKTINADNKSKKCTDKGKTPRKKSIKTST